MLLPGSVLWRMVIASRSSRVWVIVIVGKTGIVSVVVVSRSVMLPTIQRLAQFGGGVQIVMRGGAFLVSIIYIVSLNVVWTVL